MKQLLYRIYDDKRVAGEFLSVDAAEFLACTKGRVHHHAANGGTIRGYRIETLGKVEMQFLRSCKVCGAPIRSRATTEFCEECREKNRAEARIRLQERRDAQTPKPGGTKRKTLRSGEVPYERKSDLSKMAYDARKAHTTYGKLVGQIYAKEHRCKAGKR